MHIIFGNYGNNTIALIQWAYENQLENSFVVHVETGWAAPSWKNNVLRGQLFAEKYGFRVVTLNARPDLTEMIIDRKRFPSQKFQWCAGFLKGLPFLKWADQVDPKCEAIIMLGSRRSDSRARINLPEFIEDSEHFGGRKVWYPLYDYDKEKRNKLIKHAGFNVLNHRSLECDPCIHSDSADLNWLSEESMTRIANLEDEIKKTMFEKPILQHISENKKTSHREENLEIFDRSCGALYGCGE